MKRVCALALVLAACRQADAGTAAYLTPEYIQKFAVRLWKDYKQDYRHEWEGAGTEESADHQRFLLFQRNLVRASELNAQNTDATFGFNAYSDWFPEEFSRVFVGKGYAEREKADWSKAAGLLLSQKSPKSVDWGKKEKVSHVKHQGNCSAGAVFAAVGALEAASSLATGKVLRPLSEQWVLSCALADQNLCDGSSDSRLDVSAVMDAVVAAGGKVPTEQSYGYASADGSVPECGGQKDVNAHLRGPLLLPEDDKSLRRWLDQRGPFAAEVANLADWQTFQDGVPEHLCKPSETPAHSVLIVGYGTEDKLNYWLAKNSWGTAWGEHGYIRLPRGRGCISRPVAAMVAKPEEGAGGGAEL